MNERLGVLGGMGAQATNTFYQFVIDRTDARCDQDHVNALILSDSQMPDRTAAILGSEADREAVYRRLLADARLLEGAGCTVIAVPCNTSHFFLDRVQEQISIPILHMIRETARSLIAQGRTRPGILATDGTIQTQLYQKEFAAAGIRAVVPGPEAQKLVMSLIYDDVKAGRDGDPQKFAAIHQDLLAQVGELCHVTYQEQDSDNVSEAYYDTESRLITQQTKLERLQTLLAQAETMEDIITIESAISDTELEIEQLTGTLRQYDSLVDFSTVYITLQEVYQLSNVEEPATRLGVGAAAGGDRRGGAPPAVAPPPEEKAQGPAETAAGKAR